jgi:hypothetical protein
MQCPLAVIARLSEGKPWQSQRDCFVASLLAMTKRFEIATPAFGGLAMTEGRDCHA